MKIKNISILFILIITIIISISYHKKNSIIRNFYQNQVVSSENLDRVIYLPDEHGSEKYCNSIGGISIPKIYIDNKFTNKYKSKYFVSCYLYEHLFEVKINKSIEYRIFIRRNKKMLSESIYYLYSKNYGKIYRQYPSNADNLLNIKELGIDLEIVLEKLEQESSLFVYHMK